MFVFKKTLKYNVGDIVFTLINNKIVEVEIKLIQITISKEEVVEYVCNRTNTTMVFKRVYKECELFISKEELLKSL